MYIYSGVSGVTKTGNIITDNHFIGDAVGGAAYSAVYSLASQSIIANNYMTNLLEHGVYNYGSNNKIVNNQIYDLLGSTNTAGIQTFSGRGVLIAGNTLSNVRGLQISGSDLTVENNTITEGAIAFRKYISNATSTIYRNIKIRGNNISTTTVTDIPIDINVQDPDKAGCYMDGLDISGNTVSGTIANTGSIYVTTLNTSYSIKNVTINNNNITAASLYGIRTYMVQGASINNNTVTNPILYGARLYQSSRTTIDGMHVIDTNTTPVVIGLASAATGEGNSSVTIINSNLTNPASTVTSANLVTVPVDGYKQYNSINGIKAQGLITVPNSALVTVFSKTRTNSTVYALGVVAYWSTGTTVWAVTTAGTSDASAPDITGKVAGDTIVDGTMTWTMQATTAVLYNGNAGGVLTGNTIMLTPFNATAWTIQIGANRMYVNSVTIPGQFPIAAAGAIGTSAAVYRWEAIQ